MKPPPEVTDQTEALLVDGTSGSRTPVDVDFSRDSMFIRSRQDNSVFEWPYDRLVSYDLKGRRHEVVLGDPGMKLELVLRSERDLARLHRLAPKLRNPTFRRRRYLAFAILGLLLIGGYYLLNQG